MILYGSNRWGPRWGLWRPGLSYFIVNTSWIKYLPLFFCLQNIVLRYTYTYVMSYYLNTAQSSCIIFDYTVYGFHLQLNIVWYSMAHSIFYHSNYFSLTSLFNTILLSISWNSTFIRFSMFSCFGLGLIFFRDVDVVGYFSLVLLHVSVLFRCITDKWGPIGPLGRRQAVSYWIITYVLTCCRFYWFVYVVRLYYMCCKKFIYGLNLQSTSTNYHRNN